MQTMAKNSVSGISVIEVLVTLMIFSLISLIAVPGFAELQNSFNRNNAKKQLEFHVKRARTESITKGTRGILSTTSGGYSFGFDYLPYSDPPIADEVLFSATLPHDITIFVNDNIIFDSRGTLVDMDGLPNFLDITLNQYNKKFCIGKLLTTGILSYQCE